MLRLRVRARLGSAQLGFGLRRAVPCRALPSRAVPCRASTLLLGLWVGETKAAFTKECNAQAPNCGSRLVDFIILYCGPEVHFAYLFISLQRITGV